MISSFRVDLPDDLQFAPRSRSDLFFGSPMCAANKDDITSPRHNTSEIIEDGNEQLKVLVAGKGDLLMEWICAKDAANEGRVGGGEDVVDMFGNPALSERFGCVPGEITALWALRSHLLPRMYFLILSSAVQACEVRRALVR